MPAHSISRISIKGYKSIQTLESLALGDLNVLIGANGAGKSNFVSFFYLLGALLSKRLQLWTTRQGGADRVVSFGTKETPQLAFTIQVGLCGYHAALEPTAEGGFVFAKEQLDYDKAPGTAGPISLGSGHRESLADTQQIQQATPDADRGDYHAVRFKCTIFHFHDTGEMAAVKRWVASHDDGFLRSDASNLAAFLCRMQREYPAIYQKICQTVRLAVPFFDDFVFRTRELPTGEEQVWLLWKQRGSDYILWPSQLSDGSIRFVCLVTALLQPDPPGTIVIDEPELGLHPYALTLLGSLLRSASRRMQVIVATQSAALVSEFSMDDLIVVERENGQTRFIRYQEESFAAWLEEYSVGELWSKNVLGGRPRP
ncbi:MAG: AAA family ATPase [Magnetococcales bacterium]|nr:AAA family ATPase [Magnetococcales bacterium]